MTETFRIAHSASESRVKWKYGKGYLALGIFNAAIWSTVLLYLQLAPRIYTSDWVVALPKGGEQASVSLPGIGNASSSIQSPYSSNSDDPRANYQYIAASRSVLEAAATSINMDLIKFGEPRIKLVENTTLMQFQLEGANPQEARLKSLALHQALEAKLKELRVQEAAQKEARLQDTLASSQRKLLNAQQSLANYRAHSDLNSSQQITQLASTIEQLRKQQAESLVQQKQSDGRLMQLSNTLKLSPQQAKEAFDLQTDPYFQQILSDYGKSSAALVDLNSKLTRNNPTVINEKTKWEATQAALLERSQSVLKQPVTLEYIQQLSLNNSSPRQQFFQDLVSVQVEKQGLQAQAKELELQRTLFERKLKTLVQQQVPENNLQRDVQIAETIFSSTLAQLDLRSSYVFGSYPQIQLLQEPSLPESPSSPKRLYVLIGATFGSLFFTAGLVLLRLSRRETSMPKQVASV